MSAERDVNRIVRSWLREDEHDSADRVLGIVLDQLDATPQRRAWWPARRSVTMNYAKLAIAAAAVLVVAVVGFQFLPSSGGVGGPAAPTPTPSSTPAPSPSLTPAPALRDGPLDAGTYTLDRNLGITIDVPAGWSRCCDAYIGNDETGSALAFIAYMDVTNIVVYGDSCRWASTPESEPRGAEAVAAAFAAQRGREGTEPRDVTVGGRPGLHVRLTVPADLETTEQPDGDATFVDCDQGQFGTFGGPAGLERYAQNVSQVEDLYIVDVDSRTVLFDLGYYEETPAADRDALEEMLASVRIP